jgi:hypothetical protein
VTLVELLVVIVMLGMMAAVVVGVPWRSSAAAASRDEKGTAAAKIVAARDRALVAGVAVTRVIRTAEGALVITALPDGRILGADGEGFDRLSGKLVRGTDSFSVSNRGGRGGTGEATVTGVAAGRSEPR